MSCINILVYIETIEFLFKKKKEIRDGKYSVCLDLDLAIIHNFSNDTSTWPRLRKNLFFLIFARPY